MEYNRELRQSQRTMVTQVFKVQGGIPSHDTFNRFFGSLNTEEFEQAFITWVKEACSLSEGEAVAIDAKTLCISRSKSAKRAIHIVSAWSSVNQLSLAQVKIDDKSNEITAIPKLLKVLAVSGCIVPIDTMMCQREIAAKIIDRGAYYIGRQRQSGNIGRKY